MPHVIAGQGTATLELLDEVPDLDAVVAPVSGGGLLSGTALAATSLKPGIQVIGAEPAMADDASRSFRSGKLEPMLPGHSTIADGLRATLSERTLGNIRHHVNDILTVGEEDIINAMKLVWRYLKIVIEPSAAVPFAVLMVHSGQIRGKARRPPSHWRQSRPRQTPMASVTIEGIAFEAVHVPTEKTNVLLIKAAGGFLGCGYFDVNVANRVGDAAAIVTGVKTVEQMLDAPVVRLSERAKEAGVREGMTGREALILLHRTVA